MLLLFLTQAAHAVVPRGTVSSSPRPARTSRRASSFDAEAVVVLKNQFPLFVGEKAYDYAASGYAEDKLQSWQRSCGS